MSDRDLALSVRAIIEGRIVRTDSRWDAERGMVFTYVSVDVLQILKGKGLPGRIVLRQIGGVTPGHMTHLEGSPTLTPGQQFLLFLNTDNEGLLHVAHLHLGAFRVETDVTTGQKTVVQPRADHPVRRIFSSKVTATEITPLAQSTSLAQFKSSIVQTLKDGHKEAARYEAANAAVPMQPQPANVAFPEVQTQKESTTYSPQALTQPNVGTSGPQAQFTVANPGVEHRWFEPDIGLPVTVYVNPAHAPVRGGGVSAVQAALNAWSQAGARLSLRYGGTTASQGFRQDGTSAISFEDPLNQLDKPVNGKGALAATMVTSLSPEPGRTIGGITFYRSVEVDIITNNGFKSQLSNNTFLKEVLTHELGHLLGIGHSSDPDATMYYMAHNDKRGASLKADDLAAVRFIYPMDNEPLPVPGDYDGDGRADFAVFQRDFTPGAAAIWTYISSRNGQRVVIPFGTGTWFPAPADYDGDGSTDLGVFQPDYAGGPGQWYYYSPVTGQGGYLGAFGSGTWIPVPGNYLGHRKADLGVFQPNVTPGGSGRWYYLDRTTGQGIDAGYFGAGNWIPAPGKYASPTFTNPGVFQPNFAPGGVGHWYYYNRSTNEGIDAGVFGPGNWSPAPADYDGDGKADFGLRAPGGAWFYKSSRTGESFGPIAGP